MQYTEDYLKRFGCGPDSGFIKGGEEDEVEDCTPAPDCHVLENKCCKESTGPPLVSTCVDGPDCELFGDGCCEDRPVGEEDCTPAPECHLFDIYDKAGKRLL